MVCYEFENYIAVLSIIFTHKNGKNNFKLLYNWMQREDLTPVHRETRRRKIDSAALAAHVRDLPDAYLRERAAHFGVSTPSLWAALRRLKIVKKNDTLR
jgi:hypothetical protein